jgi:hypothetical protein
MSREEQMMAEADAYAAGAYADEPVCFSTEEAICETINDFVAGWRAADAHPQWIPVEERLPKVDEQTTLSNDCVVVDSAGARYFGYYNGTDECWYTDDYTMILFVTHWMPLPTPPQGKEDKK